MSATTKTLAPLFAAIAFLLMVPLGGSAAAPSCGTTSVYELYDPAGDVQQPSTRAAVAGFEEIDLIALNTCSVGDQIVVELRAKAPIVTDNAMVQYSVYVDHENASFLLGLFFSNGTARMEPEEGAGAVEWSVDGETLSLAINRSDFENLSDGWEAEASASRDLGDGGTPYDRSDWIQLDGTYGVDPTQGQSAFTSPTVGMVAISVAAEGTTMLLVAEGETTGQVAQLRATVAVREELGGIASWSTHRFWIEQAMGSGDPNASLVRVGSTWTFVLRFMPGAFDPILGTASADSTRLIVQALAPDGSWGQASQSFNAHGQERTGPDAAPDSEAGGLLPGLEAAAVLAALAAGALGVRRRRLGTS
jgi:hypothetical protein